MAQTSQERAKSRPGQINCNDFYYCIPIPFFYFVKSQLEIQALAVQIFKIIPNTVDICLKSGTELYCVAHNQNNYRTDSY